MFVSKHEGKRRFGRPMSKWEDNIKNNLEKLGTWMWLKFIWFKKFFSRRLFLI